MDILKWIAFEHKLEYQNGVNLFNEMQRNAFLMNFCVLKLIGIECIWN